MQTRPYPFGDIQHPACVRDRAARRGHCRRVARPARRRTDQAFDLLHALDGVLGSAARSAAPSSSPSRLPGTARSYSALDPEGLGPPGQVLGAGNAPSSPWRAISSARSRAPARCAAAAPAPTTPQPRRGMETARPQPGQPACASAITGSRRPTCGRHARRRLALGTGTPVRRPRQDHRRPPAPRARYPRPGSPLLRAVPVTLGTKHRAQLRPSRLAWQRRGGKPSQNRRLVCSDHGPRTSNSATCSAIACSAGSPIPRTVADGTDTGTIDRTGRVCFR